MINRKWQLTALIAVVVAFAFLGDFSHHILRLFGDFGGECEWRIYDLGNELQNACGWSLPLILLPMCRLRWITRCILHYCLTCVCVYAWIDFADELLNGNSRTIQGDLIGLSIAIGYGALSLVIYFFWLRSHHEPQPGNYYQVIRPPRSLLGLPFMLLRKPEYYMKGFRYYWNGSMWVLVTHKKRRGEVFRYRGNGKELLAKVTDMN